jgi:hypothetical protein
LRASINAAGTSRWFTSGIKCWAAVGAFIKALLGRFAFYVLSTRAAVT